MKISYKVRKGVLNIKFNLDSNEGVDHTGKVKMGRHDCNIHVPEDWNLDKIHPDVLGLIIILIAYPFVDKKIEVPIGVSQDFHDVFQKETGKLIYPVDKNLEPRTAPKDAVPGLAYSGGVDSTAALALLPESTVCFFLDRILPEDSKGNLKLYDKRTIYSTYAELAERGVKGNIVKTDLEYIRMPRGFPVELSTTIPALIFADYIGLDSIATGAIMEHQFIPYHKLSGDRDYSVNWHNIFKTVDIPLSLVTAGISEIGTMTIALNSPYSSYTHWCMRGPGSTPCMKCEKCFRKVLLQAILEKQDVSDDILDRFFLSPEVRTTLRALPIPCENVIAYITAKYNGEHKLMKALRKRTRADVLDVNWMERWYSPSKSLMAEKYSDYIEEQITKYIDIMTPEDEAAMSYWDIFKMKESRLYYKYQQDFISSLIRFKEDFKNRNGGG